MRTPPMSDASMRSVLDALPCGILLFDGDGQLVFINPQLIRMAEVDPSVLAPGTSLSDAVRLAIYRGLHGQGNPDEQAAAILSLDRTRMSQRLTRGLKGRWFDLTSVPLAEGGFFACIFEITAVKTAELAAAERADQIEAALNALSEG